MTTLSKTNLAAITLSTTHKSAALARGRDAAAEIGTLKTHIDDVVASLNQMVNDATAGNPSDTNITTLNSIITSLA